MKKIVQLPTKNEGLQNNSWPFNIDKTHNWAFANDVFTPEECKKIIKLGKAQYMHEALIGDSKKSIKKVRESKTSWIFPSDEHNWIFYRMTNVVEQLNREYFNFNLFGFTEGFQFTEYESPSGHYSKHIDKIFGKTIRKLSITVQLSNPTDYQGGALQLIFGGKPDVMDKSQGKAIAFPSYVMHEVKPITKGTRYSLVAWVTGDYFK